MEKCDYCLMLNQHIDLLKNELEHCEPQYKYATLLELKSYYWLVETYCNTCLQNCTCVCKTQFADILSRLKKLFESHQLELNVEQKHCDICKILPCEIFSLLDHACLLSDNDKIESMCIELQYHIFLSLLYGEIIGKCTNCDNFVEYNACLESACNFIQKRNMQQLQEFVYFWKIARNNDKILSCVNDIMPSQHKPSKINTNNHITVYLDFNVYTQYEKDSSVKRFLDELCTRSEISIVCSGTHLEEIPRMEAHDYEQKRMQSILSLTKGKIVLVDEHGYLSICTDDLEERLKQIEQYKMINQMAEERECINAEARNHLSLHESDSKRDSAIGSSSLIQLLSNENNPKRPTGNSFKLPNEDDLNKILRYVGLGDHDIQKYRNMFKSQDSKFADIRMAIVSIAQLLNILGLHGDKIEKKTHPNAVYPIYCKESYRTIRSGYYDNDHLSFAANCTYFVTHDGPLYKKACEIYNFLGIATTPVLLDDFMKKQI